MNEHYKICNRCVMDTSDPVIGFDQNGTCTHCTEFDEVTSKNWFPNDEGKRKLDAILKNIKIEGKNNDYDCVIGLSGGVDSSYLALILKDYGLRPLVVHVDAGWNSEVAVYNIEQIVKFCGYDLHTHVMNWEEIRDLQVAYLKAGISNQDVIQDHAFFSSLYHFAVKNKIKYVISGGNIATESVFPKTWHHSAMDAINLHAIHKKFGKLKLKQYKTIGFFSNFFYYPFVKGMTVIRPLNYMPYNKVDALQMLKDKIGYKEYGRKHGESRFTKFFQNEFLPKKFNIDKRRPHLSSQILSGELTRDQALSELSKELYNSIELDEDVSYIAKKLNLSIEEFKTYIYSEGCDYSDFANWDKRYTSMRKIRFFIEKVFGKKVKTYS